MPIQSDHEAGMTLAEMLVVLAIIGIAAGAVSLSIGPLTRKPGGEAEAQRLAQQLQLAADDAMVDDKIVTLNWDNRSYHVTGAEAHRLPDSLHLDIPGHPARLPIDGTPFEARLDSSDQQWRVRFDGISARPVKADQP